MNSLSDIERLKAEVVATFTRTLDSPTDFDALSADIMHRTGEGVSSSTLRRLYGYIKPAVVPRPSTLSVLARYVGRAGWSEFCNEACENSTPEGKTPANEPHRRRWYVAAAVGAVAVVVLALYVLSGVEERTDKSAPITIVESAEEGEMTPKQRVLNRYKAESLQFCDEVRRHRNSTDILAYKRLVDSAYNAFVFDYLRPTITREISEAYPTGAECDLHTSEVFSECRDICSTLLREIDYKEWHREEEKRCNERWVNGK